jgi:hypothetical protein
VTMHPKLGKFLLLKPLFSSATFHTISFMLICLCFYPRTGPLRVRGAVFVKTTSITLEILIRVLFENDTSIPQFRLGSQSI